MKIVALDNFNRDYIPDFLVASDVNKYIGEKIVDFLNESEGENSPNFYILVEDNYKLRTLDDIY